MMIFITQASAATLCQGLLPANRLRIPPSFYSQSKVDQSTYEHILKHLEDHYRDEVAAHGGKLIVQQLWHHDDVNASAFQSGRQWMVSIYGGLARYPEMTATGLALAACHELGHHLGGAPKKKELFTAWPSSEGQSDYYATLKCMRVLLSPPTIPELWQEDQELLLPSDQDTLQNCQRFTNQLDQEICRRTARAAMTIAKLAQSVSETPIPVPSFSTPSTEVVTKDFDGHPSPQCRLDTFWAGTLCPIPVNEPLDDRDETKGTCMKDREPLGARPACWFNPDRRKNNDPLD